MGRWREGRVRTNLWFWLFWVLGFLNLISSSNSDMKARLSYLWGMNWNRGFRYCFQPCLGSAKVTQLVSDWAGIMNLGLQGIHSGCSTMQPFILNEIKHMKALYLKTLKLHTSINSNGCYGNVVSLEPKLKVWGTVSSKEGDYKIPKGRWLHKGMMSSLQCERGKEDVTLKQPDQTLSQASQGCWKAEKGLCA